MTKGYKLPTITTVTPSNIEYHAATVGGNISSDGGTEVTERGICYSTTENPTIEGNKIVSGKGTGNYTSNLTGLQDSTTYYVRAYAINKKGIAYGEQVSFMTKGYQLPTIMTSYVTNISYLSATIGGDVTSDGGATVTERGIVYSTSQNPTTSNGKVQSGSGTGSFTCLLSDLQESTTYYIRTYAQNAKGINYGNQLSFTTIEKPYFTVGESQKISFSSGNLQYHPADNKWRFAENQTDYIGESNRNMSSSYNGWVDLFYWSSSKCRFGVTKPDITTDAGLFVDWGTNQIGNDAPNTWRTLSYDEWDYLRHMRANADVLCGVAMVNGVNGLVFLPDNWTCPLGVTFKPGFHSNDGVDYYAAYQTFTADLWLKLEAAGAVFLPAAGIFNYNLMGSQDVGGYWSATQQNYYYIYYLYFSSTKAEVDEYTRGFRISVRLVKDL